MPRRSSVRRAAVAVLLIAPALAACSSGHSGASAPVGATTSVGASASAAASSAPTPSASPSVDYPTTLAAPGTAPMQVRDAFAVLQATYNDGCTTPGNCAYFLNRVLSNLDDLDNAMKASPEGTGHFRQPLTWIDRLHTALAADFSFTNLQKHQKQLVATRDEINTWMQSHPEDYR
ncbi:hypothetical protein DN069_10195 [Streptacidiphilus pinicola]|uniref:Uncharacterized protein n=1 Tax=Streptacidiphilus pinicola TaxID=2219663 RepID=A0A2X0KG80_9ACTN|nr:hypothetical protein [Streptacidiphilus pinicola]RAG85860.1 hypothetical protein DN069_10195 [Streptacidiphilus pinicola]